MHFFRVSKIFRRKINTFYRKLIRINWGSGGRGGGGVNRNVDLWNPDYVVRKAKLLSDPSVGANFTDEEIPGMGIQLLEYL